MTKPFAVQGMTSLHAHYLPDSGFQCVRARKSLRLLRTLSSKSLFHRPFDLMHIRRKAARLEQLMRQLQKHSPPLPDNFGLEG